MPRRPPKPRKSSRASARDNLLGTSVALAVCLGFLVWVTTTRGIAPIILVVMFVHLIASDLIVNALYLLECRRHDRLRSEPERRVTLPVNVPIAPGEVCPRCGDLVAAAEQMQLPGCRVCRSCVERAGGAGCADWIASTPELVDANAPSLLQFLRLAWLQVSLGAALLLSAVAVFVIDQVRSERSAIQPWPFYVAIFAVIMVLLLLFLLRWQLLRDARVAIMPEGIQAYSGGKPRLAMAFADMEGVIRRGNRRIAFGSGVRSPWPETYHPALRFHFFGPRADYMLATAEILWELERARGAARVN